MKKKGAPVYIRHWIVIIVGVIAALAVRSHLRQAGRVEFVPAQSVQHPGDTRFVAMLYPRITRRPESDSMSKRLFLEHMTMLRSAGYSIIGLQQIRDLYYADKLLPEKALVVILDGFRDTCENAVPVIKELGLRATMLLNVGAMRQNNHSFMSWHDLKKMQSDRLWDFGIATGGDGDPEEQLEYLQDRFNDIRVRGVSAPIDFDNFAAFAHKKMLYFPRRDGDGYNSIDTDPSCLNMLKVKPQQDRHELTQLLSNIFSQSPRFEDEFIEDTTQLNWASTCGYTAVRNGMLGLSAGPSQSSADTWLAGTYDWGDVDLAAKFRIAGGRQFWAYVRFRNDDNYLRLGCNGIRLFLQQKIAGAKVRNLKVVEFDGNFSQFHDLRLIVRGRYAIAYLDGRKLSERPFRIDDSLVSGKVGFAIWDPLCGIASCQIAGVSIRKLPCITLMNIDRHQDASRWISKYSDYLSYLCPNSLSLKNPHVECNIEDYEALMISAAYSGHELTPTIILEENALESNAPNVLAGELTNLMEKYRFGGLHLDCRGCRNKESFTALAEMLRALKTNSPESALILSLSPQGYQTCEELLKTADILVLQLEDRQCDLLDKIARPIRLKMLLQVETDEPEAFIGNLVSSRNAESTTDLVKSAVYIVENYDLKGIALCEK